MGQGTLEEVRDGLRDPRGGTGLVGGPSGSFGTRRGGPGRVGDPRGSPVRVWGPLFRSGRGLGNFLEIRDGSGEPRGGPGRVRGRSGRSGTGRRVSRGGPRWAEEIWDGSIYPWAGSRRVGGPSGRFGTGRVNFGEVLDGSRRSVTGRGTSGEVRKGLWWSGISWGMHKRSVTGPTRACTMHVLGSVH